MLWSEERASSVRWSDLHVGSWASARARMLSIICADLVGDVGIAVVDIVAE